MIIDSHCHINDPVYVNNPKQYVDEAKTAGVKIMLVVGFDLDSSIKAIEIAEKFEGVYAAVGIIPAEVKNAKNGDLEKIESLLKCKKVIAIGEIGLDYFWDKEDSLKYSQREYFIKQIELANKYNLPVCVHSRDAIEDTYNILKNHVVNCGGVIHCYSGSPEMAKLFIDLGYLLGIGGTVTFKNSLRPKEVAKMVNRKNYVLETDAPYLTPVPYRGKVNHSKYLSFIRDEIANLKGISPQEVDNDTTDNFKRLFKL